LAGIELPFSTEITIAQLEPTIAPAQKATSTSAAESVTSMDAERTQATPITPSITTTSTSNTHTNTNQQTDNNNTNAQATTPPQTLKKESFERRAQKQFTLFRSSVIRHLWGTGSFKQNYKRRISTVSITALITTLIAAQYASNKLIKAALRGDNNTVKTLLEIPLPFDINRVAYYTGSSTRGLSALHAASRSGNAATVSLLLRHHANPNIVNYKSVTPLHEAAYRYDGSEIVTKLLEANASVNLQDQTGTTALIYATLRNPVTVKLLLENNANPLIADNWGNLPLHIAAREHQPETIEILLLIDASVINKQTSNGNTPLHDAAGNNNKPENQLLATLQILLQHGSNPLIVNYDKELPRDLTRNNKARALLEEREKYVKAHQRRTTEQNISGYTGTTLARAFTRVIESYKEFKNSD